MLFVCIAISKSVSLKDNLADISVLFSDLLFSTKQKQTFIMIEYKSECLFLLLRRLNVKTGDL